MHDRNNAQYCSTSSYLQYNSLGDLQEIICKVNFNFCLCLSFFFPPLCVCRVMQSIWSEAKEISLSWPAAILTRGLPVSVVFDALLLQSKIWDTFSSKRMLNLCFSSGVDRCSQPSLRKWRNSLDIAMKSKTESFLRCNVWVVSIKSC